MFNGPVRALPSIDYFASERGAVVECEREHGRVVGETREVDDANRVEGRLFLRNLEGHVPRLTLRVPDVEACSVVRFEAGNGLSQEVIYLVLVRETRDGEQFVDGDFRIVFCPEKSTRKAVRTYRVSVCRA